jgi:hypothetical protein
VRPVAWILVLLLGGVAIADTFYCVDGCNRGGLTMTDRAPGGLDCPVCQSASVPTLTPAVYPPVPLVSADREHRADTIDVPAPRLEHPPRLVG